MLTDFSRSPQCKKALMKIHPVGAKLLCSDRQTDMTELIGAFRNFSERA
jgi:hypothetical protein